MLFRMKSVVNRSFLALALLTLGACSLLHPGRGVKSCRYGFRAITFSGFEGSQSDWKLDLSVVNPNSHPVTLNRMHFALMHDQDTLLSGWNPEKRVLAPGDSQTLETTLEFPIAALGRLPPALLADADAQFTLVGDAYLDTWVGAMRFPGALRQTIHVNMPKQLTHYRDLLMNRFFAPWMSKGAPPSPDSAVPPPQPPPADDTL
jgi:hypothetical protein